MFEHTNNQKRVNKDNGEARKIESYVCLEQTDTMDSENQIS